MKYKLRAECEHDINALKKRLKVEEFLNDEGFPDCEVIIESSLTLSEIRDFIRLISDGHVMLQTIQLAHEYDGIRDYSLS